MEIRIWLLFGAAALTACVTRTAAKADFFSSLAGVVTDPLKLGRLSDSVDRSLIQLNALEKQGDAMAHQRLEELRSIIDFALKGGQAVEEKALADVASLENKINEDADRLIYKAQCAAITVLNDTLQQAVVSATSNIAKSHPSFVIAGYTVAELRIKPVTIANPSDAYYNTRDAVISDLNKTQGEIEPAYNIVSAYQNLERLAKATECAYLGQGFQGRFIREANEMERLSSPWIRVVYPTR